MGERARLIHAGRSAAYIFGLCTAIALASATMIPEAYEHAHDFAGLITVAGFMAAFVLSKMG